MNDLTPLQELLFCLFKDKPNTDIQIYDMYVAVYGVRAAIAEDSDIRHKQQKLSPLLQRLNARLPEGHRIEPGQLKRTYRLNTKASV